MSEKILEKTIEKAKKKDVEADASLSSGWGKRVTFKGKKIKSVTSAQKESLSLRLITKHKKIGLSATNKVVDGEEDTILDDALEVSKYGKVAKFNLPKSVVGKVTPKTFDENLSTKNVDYLIEAGNKALDMVMSHKSKMRLESIDISLGMGRSTFMNTNGIREEEEKTMLSFSLETSKITEGDFFQLGSGRSSTRNDIDFEGETKKLLTFAEWGSRVAKISSGKYPVVFAPECVPQVTDYVLRSLSGKYVNEGSSKFKGELGKKVFDERFSIYDDATLDHFSGSQVIDDEGMAARRTTLIEKGVVKHFFYDLQQAAKAKTKSTGNGSKGGMFSGVSPGISNTVIGKGDTPYKDLIKDLPEGILGYYFLGAGQDNPFNGDFRLSTYMGFKIENGEIVGRLKDTAITGNIFDLLKNNLLWLSEDREKHESIYVPYVCFDGVDVLSK